MGVTKGKSATSLSLELQIETEFSFFLVAASPHWDFETWDDSGAVLVPGRGLESQSPGPPLPLTAFWYVLKLAWDQYGAGSKGTSLLEGTYWVCFGGTNSSAGMFSPAFLCHDGGTQGVLCLGVVTLCWGEPAGARPAFHTAAKEGLLLGVGFLLAYVLHEHKRVSGQVFANT